MKVDSRMTGPDARRVFAQADGSDWPMGRTRVADGSRLTTHRMRPANVYSWTLCIRAPNRTTSALHAMLSRMNARPSHSNSRLLAVLCALLLLVRVDGGHLHLCLDGAESPVSLHAVDLRGHHEGEVVSVAHFDVDLPFPGEAWPRSVDTGEEPILASTGVAHPALRDGKVCPSVRITDAPACAPARYLTPPVCGPPTRRLV